MEETGKAKLAVWKFASCDGCQLSLLDCEDEFLAVADAVEIAHFPEATRASAPGPYDLSLVEGSIATEADRARILEVRKQSKRVVTIGACAAAGGIQALRNGRDVAAFAAAVYAQPQYIDALAASTPIADHIDVDFELRGCPINKRQLLEVISAFLVERRPAIPTHSVCLECKARGVVCVMAAGSEPCMGPVTQAGCGAICPAYRRGCYGCYGPMEQPNTAALARQWADLGVSRRRIHDAFRSFNAAAPAFKAEADAHAD